MEKSSLRYINWSRIFRVEYGDCFIFPCKSRSYGGQFLTLNKWGYVVAIIGGFLGALIGGITAALISGFDLGLTKSTILGAVINTIIFLAFYVYDGGELSVGPKYSLLSLIPIGVISAAIVSRFNSSRTGLD